MSEPGDSPLRCLQVAFQLLLAQKPMPDLCPILLSFSSFHGSRGAGLCKGARGGASVRLRSWPRAAGDICDASWSYLPCTSCAPLEPHVDLIQRLSCRWGIVTVLPLPKAAAKVGRMPSCAACSECKLQGAPPTSTSLRPQLVPHLPPRLPSHLPAAAALRRTGAARRGGLLGRKRGLCARVCAAPCEPHLQHSAVRIGWEVERVQASCSCSFSPATAASNAILFSADLFLLCILTCA